jgi:hypothetical protein
MGREGIFVVEQQVLSFLGSRTFGGKVFEIKKPQANA